ncbi:DNA mismatch repair protein MutS [Galdieria sulphuraria]|nr:DNA mismatch repair protein MutS [Galdieria sulphuraria]
MLTWRCFHSSKYFGNIYILQINNLKRIQHKNYLCNAAKDNRKLALVSGRRILDQYNNLKRQYPGFLLFLRIGDFYETFLEDARTASQLLGIALARAHGYKTKGQELPMAGVPFWAFDSYLQRLVKAGIRVAIADQVFDGKDKSSRKVTGRAISRLVTPGTLTEEDLLQPSENNFLACVIFETGTLSNWIGLCWLDISTGNFQCALETSHSIQEAIHSISPSEILVLENHYEILQRTLPNIDNRCTVSPISFRNTYLENHSDWKQVVFSMEETLSSFQDKKKKLLSSLDISSISELEKEACGLLLLYVERTLAGELPFLSSICKSPVSTFMRMDMATRKVLEISRRMNSSDDSQRGSLLAAIRKTQTTPGARLLAMRVNAPLTCKKSIEERLDAVELLCRHPHLLERLRKVLKNCPEFERPLQRLFMKRGSPRDLLDLGVTFQQVSDIKKLLDEIELPDYLQYLLRKFQNHEKLKLLLDSCISENAPKSFSSHSATWKRTQLFGEGYIVTGYHSELDSLRGRKDELLRSLKELEIEYQKWTSTDSLKINFNSNLDCHLLNEQLNMITDQIQELEDSIFDKVTEQVTQHAHDIREMLGALAELDVSCALAALALERNFCRPLFVEPENANIFHVKDGRHATLEHRQLDRRTDETFSMIPNDCFLDKHNAQIGSFVPASNVKMSIVDRIFCRVGASDDIYGGQSTFMLEMNETANILKHATKNSLVIMDEVGRGTSMLEGLAIAQSIVEYLHDHIGCRTLFATHLHELASLREKLTSVACYYSEAFLLKETESLCFTYKVLKGSMQCSYASKVAELADMPTPVVRRTNELLKGWKTNALSEQHMDLFRMWIEKLKNIDLDALSPREATNLLMQWKGQLQQCEEEDGPTRYDDDDDD